MSKLRGYSNFYFSDKDMQDFDVFEIPNKNTKI